MLRILTWPIELWIGISMQNMMRLFKVTKPCTHERYVYNALWTFVSFWKSAELESHITVIKCFPQSYFEKKPFPSTNWSIHSFSLNRHELAISFSCQSLHTFNEPEKSRDKRVDRFRRLDGIIDVLNFIFFMPRRCGAWRGIYLDYICLFEMNRFLTSFFPENILFQDQQEENLIQPGQ